MQSFSREELHALVWKHPVRTIAGTLGCSDVWLKKICSQAGIPVPERGYWAKLRAGKPAQVGKLPPRAPGVPQTIGFGEERFFPRWNPDPEEELAQPLPVPPEFPEPLEAVLSRIEKAVPKVKFQRDFSLLHHAIQHVLDEDELRRTKPPTAPTRIRWSEPKFDSAFERRRFRILNSIFTGLSRAGYKCWIGDEDARSVGVDVGSQRVRFALDHPKAKPDREGKLRARPGPIDLLTLSIDAIDQRWTDGPGAKLEDHLTEIVVQLIYAGERQYRRGREYHYERACQHRTRMEELLRKRRDDAAKADKEAREKAERRRRRALLRMSRDRRHAEEIRELVQDAATNMGDLPPAQAETFSKWSEWALEVADRTDPLKRIRFLEDGSMVLAEPELPVPD